MFTRRAIVTSVRRGASETRCEAAPRSSDVADLRARTSKKTFRSRNVHRPSTFLPQLFHRSLAAAAILATAVPIIAAQTIDPQSLYRIFLTNGRALASY